MKQKISVKMSEENITFWKNFNINCIKIDKLKEVKSYSYLQSIVVNYFKLNNDNYLELLDLAKKMEERKNGIK